MFNLAKLFSEVVALPCTSAVCQQFCQFIYLDEQCVRVMVDLYPLQHLLLSDFFVFADQMGIK